jgi:hypothetical protein
MGDDEKVLLGDKYRDNISGFEGTATARSEFLFGCVRVCLEGGKDGELKTEWFDEQRLVRLDGSVPVPTATSGGPRSGPPSRDPR